MENIYSKDFMLRAIDQDINSINSSIPVQLDNTPYYFVELGCRKTIGHKVNNSIIWFWIGSFENYCRIPNDITIKEKYKLKDIFCHTSIANTNFVEPQGFADLTRNLQLALGGDQRSKVIVIDGDNKVGKTTVLKKAIAITESLTQCPIYNNETIHEMFNGDDDIYETIIIDGYEELNDEHKEIIKNHAEMICGQPRSLPLVIAGRRIEDCIYFSELMQEERYYDFCYWYYPFKHTGDSEILNMIETGTNLLRICFDNPDVIVTLSERYLWFAQFICARICEFENITEEQDVVRSINITDTYVRERIRRDINTRHRYYQKKIESFIGINTGVSGICRQILQIISDGRWHNDIFLRDIEDTLTPLLKEELKIFRETYNPNVYKDTKNLIKFYKETDRVRVCDSRLLVHLKYENTELY